MEQNNITPPQHPEYFNAYMAAEWDKVCTFLIAEGRFKNVSMVAIESYCVDCDLVRRINKEIAEGNLLVKGQRGELKKNPAFMAKDQAHKRIFDFGKEFGLTPKARKTIGVQEGSRGPKRKRVALR